MATVERPSLCVVPPLYHRDAVDDDGHCEDHGASAGSAEPICSTSIEPPASNQLVRFKLHEVADVKEGIIRAIDQHGYWIEGGSYAEYLRSTSPGVDAHSEVQFIESKRIHWTQKV